MTHNDAKAATVSSLATALVAVVVAVALNGWLGLLWAGLLGMGVLVSCVMVEHTGWFPERPDTRPFAMKED